MSSWWRILIYIHLSVSAYGKNCLNNEKIIENLADNKNRGQIDLIEANIVVDDWKYFTDKNTLEFDATIKFNWTNIDNAFSHLSPCNSKIEIDHNIKQTFLSDISIPKALSHNINSGTLWIFENGTSLYFLRVQNNINCKSTMDMYPFGNILCNGTWKHSGNREEQIHFEWSEKTFNSSNDLINRGSLFLRDVTGSLNNENLFQLAFVFSKSSQEILLHFFAPSIMFIIPPLLTLLLGPMAITRCSILMASLILLSIHYHGSASSIPMSDGVNAITVWKLFSYLFVIGIVFELVIITLLASIGRSRSCCSSKHRSGRYEMEPLYEEMNDLRQRKTRRTRNCCRKAAFLFDIISFIFFSAVYVLFCYVYYTKRGFIVKMINEYNMDSLKIF